MTLKDKIKNLENDLNYTTEDDFFGRGFDYAKEKILEIVDEENKRKIKEKRCYRCGKTKNEPCVVDHLNWIPKNHRFTPYVIRYSKKLTGKVEYRDVFNNKLVITQK